MADAAVVIDALHVRRGGRAAVRGVSCTVAAGSVTGLLGPSGCGKTTLLRVVVGVQIVAGGSVTVLGHPAGSAVLRDRIGYSTQSAALYADLTVAENLRYFAAVLRAPRSSVERVIAQVDLHGHEDKLAATLSDGQRSRASLAVALLGTPELLVLDEPTVGLDPVLRDRLWSLFHRLAADGATLLVSTHVMDEAARCAGLLVMREGELLAEGTPAELCRRSGAEDLERAFLALVRERQGAGR